MKNPEAFKTRILRAQQGRALSTNAHRLEVLKASLDVCDSLLESVATSTTPVSEKLQAKIDRLKAAKADLTARLSGPPIESTTVPTPSIPHMEPDLSLDKPISQPNPTGSQDPMDPLEPSAPLEPLEPLEPLPLSTSVLSDPPTDYSLLTDMFDVLTPEASENRGGDEHVVKLNPNRGSVFIKPPRRRLHKKPAKKWDPDPSPDVPPPPQEDDESQYIEDEDDNLWEDMDDQDYDTVDMMSQQTGAEKKAESFLYNPVVGVVSKSRGVTAVDFNDVGVGPTKYPSSKT